MISKDLKIIADDLELKTFEDYLYGANQNILVSVYEDKTSITLCIDICMVDYPERCSDYIADFCQKHSEKFNILNLQISSTGLKLDFEKTEKTFTNVLGFFYSFVKEFAHYEFNSFEKCTNCAEPLNNYAIIAIDGFAHVCDKQCATKITVPISKGEVKYVKNSFSGYIGALLFSLIGGYLWFDFALRDFPILLSSLSIALLAHLGYVVFGGKPSIERFFAVTLFPVLCVVAANFASFGFLLADKWRQEGFAVDIVGIVEQISSSIALGQDVAYAFWSQNIVGAVVVLLVAVILAKAKKKGLLLKNDHIKLFEGDYKYRENSSQPISASRAR